MDDLLPRLTVPIPANGGCIPWAEVFAPPPDEPPDDLWLEIGFGTGEHLAQVAAACPHVGFIGCEPYINGVASLLERIERLGLDNIRVFCDDARLLLPVIPPAAVGRVFLLFPDPWPKKRHADRRLVNDETLDRLALIMRDGAELRFASDDLAYVHWTLEALTRHRRFEPAETTASVCNERPPDWPPTRYEEKARARGATCTYVTFVRRNERG